jgi:hypothetical protein
VVESSKGEGNLKDLRVENLEETEGDEAEEFIMGDRQ